MKKMFPMFVLLSCSLFACKESQNTEPKGLSRQTLSAIKAAAWREPMALGEAQLLYRNYMSRGVKKSEFVTRGIRIDTSNLIAYIDVYRGWAAAGVLRKVRDSIIATDKARYEKYNWVIAQIPGVETDSLGNDKVYVMIIPVLQAPDSIRPEWINPLDYNRLPNSNPYKHNIAAGVYLKFISKSIIKEKEEPGDSISFFDYGQKEP